jgi:hypothetical protein
MEGKMAALGTQTVGVISSIACGQSFQNAFENALNAVNGQKPVSYFDRAGYDSSLLYDAVTCFTNDPAIGLIVTFGGMIAYNAAKQVAADQGGAAKNFISLTATDPVSARPCLGGVSLESFTYNTPVPIPATFTANSPNVSPAGGLKAKDLIAFAPGRGASCRLASRQTNNIQSLRSLETRLLLRWTALTP